MSGITDESLINLLIEKTKIELSSRGATYETSWDNVIEDIVIFKLNRLNHEGTSQYSGSGMSEVFTDGYPSYITSQLSSLGLPIIGKGAAKLL